MRCASCPCMPGCLGPIMPPWGEGPRMPTMPWGAMPGMLPLDSTTSDMFPPGPDMDEMMPGCCMPCLMPPGCIPPVMLVILVRVLLDMLGRLLELGMGPPMELIEVAICPPTFWPPMLGGMLPMGLPMPWPMSGLLPMLGMALFIILGAMEEFCICCGMLGPAVILLSCSRCDNCEEFEINIIQQVRQLQGRER